MIRYLKDNSRTFTAALAIPCLMASTAAADMTPAAEACIDRLRAVGGPDGQGGEVLSTSFSEAGTLVMLKDKGGTVWRCIAYSDGSIGELIVADAADDGGGAMAGAAPQSEVQVRFAPGTTGATYSADLGSGDAVRYVLGARNEQFLTVELRGNSPALDYIIYVPNGDILFESSQGGDKYYGQLYMTGDHVVEVFYNGDAGTTGSYDVIFQID